MCDLDFDYTLTIEYERLSVEELKDTLAIFYRSSSECFVDIENLADEVIIRLVECQYNIRERQNKDLNQLIVSTFPLTLMLMVFVSSFILIKFTLFEKWSFELISLLPVLQQLI